MTKTWICRTRIESEECGQIVFADDRPAAIKWTDGHICAFEEEGARPPRFGLQEHEVFWSQTGEVVCACCHVPYPGSDTWVWERWSEITPATMAEIDRNGGNVKCEGCGKEPRR